MIDTVDGSAGRYDYFNAFFLECLDCFFCGGRNFMRFEAEQGSVDVKKKTALMLGFCIL